MRRLTISLLILATAIFIGSGIANALLRGATDPATGLDAFTASDDILSLREAPPSLPGGLAGKLWHPAGPLQATLLFVIWSAATIYTLRVSGLIARFRLGREAQPLQPVPTTEALSVAIGLIAAAMAPWVIKGNQIGGLTLSALSFTAIVYAALNRRAANAAQGPSMSLGVLAAGATLLLCSAFASVLAWGLPISNSTAALIAILGCATIAAKVQLSMGSPIIYSGTIIWALLGLLIATMNSNSLIASAAVLAIAFVGVALVRVAS